MDGEVWRSIAAIVASAVGGGGALSVWLKRRSERSAKKDAQDTKQALRDVAATYTILNELLVNVAGAVRVAIVRTENSGGIPGPERKVYSSVIHEVHGRTVQPVRDGWDRVPVGPQYAELLSDLLADGECDLYTKFMDPGALRDLYEAQRIVRGHVRALCADKSGFTYLTINCQTEGQLTASERDRLRQAILDLQALMRRGCAVTSSKP